MSHSSGTKVTSDPETVNNPVSEGAGVITSDSLAAESLSSGGDFGSTTGAVASKQPSKSTTTNTTDTSNATELAAAPDADARLAKESWSETAQLNAGREITENNAVFGGRTGGSSGPGVAGGNANAGVTATTNAASGAGERGAAEQGNGLFQPKGANLTEGGFDGNEPNASFNQDIGGSKDPARVALQGLQKKDAQQAGSGGRTDEKLSNDGQFDVLKDASA
ncbi:Hypothetical protein D9617_3g020870 [Elsinoe fawcettii]|nr:Hypothetical protein D9617_3g020870 [Elsinoe fawcettii]